MPSLDSMDFSKEADSVIVYGPPKSGKTELVGKLSNSKKLIWFDIENGGKTLAKLPKSLQAKIDYYRIRDTIESPHAIEVAMKLMAGQQVELCLEHGKIMCAECLTQRKEFAKLCLRDYPPEDYVIVWDSLTQLTTSAINKVAQQFKVDFASGKKFEFDHWNMVSVYLNRFFIPLQNAPWNNIGISHETALKMEDGTDKLVPAGGTENYSRNVARFFGHAVYLQVLNNKHNGHSSTIAVNKILTGSRTDIIIDMSSENPLGPIFEQPVEKQPTATAVKKPASLLATLNKR